ncbi:hypothetical protein QJS66_14430 [Kocuria rhizophila]|nr:hypothetical protein QJS66_14430 [Kocuria rhizophila]
MEQAYRTGRGWWPGAVVSVEIHNRACLVVAELPCQVNPDNLAIRIADLVKDGKVQGMRGHARRDLRAHRSAPGHRAQARRRSQGGARQPLQAHAAAGKLSANMLALVDGVPRTLSLDAFVHHWVTRRMEVVVSGAPGTASSRRGGGARSLRGLLKALDAPGRGHRPDPPLPTVEEAAATSGAAGSTRRRPGDPQRAAAAPGRPGTPEDPGPARSCGG